MHSIHLLISPLGFTEMQVCPGRIFEAYFPSTNPVAESITEPLERGDEGLEEFGHRAFPSARKTDDEWQRVDERYRNFLVAPCPRESVGAVTLSAPGFLVARYFLRAHAIFRAFSRKIRTISLIPRATPGLSHGTLAGRQRPLTACC